MNADERRARRRAPRRRVHRGRTIALVLGAVLLFVLGIALGQAIADNDAGGGSVTYSRTIRVAPEPPTVTVTVTGP